MAIFSMVDARANVFSGVEIDVSYPEWDCVLRRKKSQLEIKRLIEIKISNSIKRKIFIRILSDRIKPTWLVAFGIRIGSEWIRIKVFRIGWYWIENLIINQSSDYYYLAQYDAQHLKPEWLGKGRFLLQEVLSLHFLKLVRSCNSHWTFSQVGFIEQNFERFCCRNNETLSQRFQWYIYTEVQKAPRAPREGTNSARLFTLGETKAFAKSKVHQWSRAWVTVRG